MRIYARALFFLSSTAEERFKFLWILMLDHSLLQLKTQTVGCL